MRMLHTMLRVTDLDASIQFYTEVLGMQLLRRRDYETGRFTLAFVGYGDEASNTVLELTQHSGLVLFVFSWCVGSGIKMNVSAAKVSRYGYQAKPEPPAQCTIGYKGFPAAPSLPFRYCYIDHICNF